MKKSTLIKLTSGLVLGTAATVVAIKSLPKIREKINSLKDNNEFEYDFHEYDFHEYDFDEDDEFEDENLEDNETFDDKENENKKVSIKIE